MPKSAQQLNNPTNHESPTAPVSSANWRVGRRVGINVYEGDRPVCQCHTVDDARRIVAAMNEATMIESDVLRAYELRKTFWEGYMAGERRKPKVRQGVNARPAKKRAKKPMK